jgi:hypothetical protein
MRLFRTVAVGMMAWAALGSIAHAAPLSWFGPQSQYPVWYANQSLVGGTVAPQNSTTTSFYLGNYGNGWWNSPVSYATPPTASSPATAIVASPTPISTPAPAATTSSATSAAEAYINFGTSGYASASSLTTGTAQGWYSSPSVVSAFGGTPNAQQQASFTQSVLADIQRTFQISGMDVSLTTNPNAPAAHTMSVASGVSAQSNPGAIGLTQVSGNGFSFIDKLSYATTPDQLAWAVAHNISHELMHAFGVATHPDQTGTYLDSATATWSMLTDPNTRFSPQSVQLMLSSMGGSSGINSSLGAELLTLSKHPANCQCQFCQMMRQMGINASQILEAAVPEPATMAMWSIAAVGGIVVARRKSTRRAA